MPVFLESVRVLFIVAGMLATLAMPHTVKAAEWTAETAVTARYEHNDNINLSLRPQNSVRGSIVTPSLDLGVNTPIWQLSGGASASQRRYSGQEGLDRDDSASRLSTVYRTERNRWQLNASRSLTSILSSDSISSDTGVVQAQLQTETKTVAPTWTWNYSKNTLLQVMYQQSDVAYENTQSAALYDYDYQSTTVTLSNQISVLNQIFVTGGYSKFHVPDTGLDSDTFSLQIGTTRIFSQTVQGTIQAGMRTTESTTRGGIPIYTRFTTIVNGQPVDVLLPTGITQDSQSETNSSVYSGNLEKKFEKVITRFAVSRTLSPSGSGGQTELDAVNFNLRNPLSPRLTLSVNANWQKTRAIEGNISNNDLTYYNFSPGIDWQWLRDLSVAMDYRYAHVKREHENAAADSHSVGLALVYRPLKWSISR